MTPGWRAALLRWAEAADTWIIEDDYDGDYRYGGRPLRPLRAIASHGADRRVVYSGTFAKVLAPALRLGFLLAPAGLASAFEAARALADRQPPVPEQAVLAHFIAEDHLATHLRRMRVLYVERRDALLRALEAECAGLLAWEPRDVGAGLHLTVMFRDPAVDGVAVSEAAARIGVQAPPLSSYALGRGRARLVLAFAATPAERMVDARHRLRCAAGVAVGG